MRGSAVVLMPLPEIYGTFQRNLPSAYGVCNPCHKRSTRGWDNAAPPTRTTPPPASPHPKFPPFHTRVAAGFRDFPSPGPVIRQTAARRRANGDVCRGVGAVVAPRGQADGGAVGLRARADSTGALTWRGRQPRLLDPLEQQAHRPLGLEVERLRHGRQRDAVQAAIAMSSKPTIERSRGHGDADLLAGFHHARSRRCRWTRTAPVGARARAAPPPAEPAAAGDETMSEPGRPRKRGSGAIPAGRIAAR